MTEPRALARVFEKSDAQFFAEHRERQAHIRNAYLGECEEEFRSLGYHEKNRRRILLCRVDYQGKPLPDSKILKIPMLVYSDETIVDTDQCLIPILHELMFSTKAMMQQ